MTAVTIVRIIEAPLEAVFSAFTDPDKIALWWGPDDGPVLSAQIDARVGGRFHVRFRLASDGSEHGSSGTYRIVEPPRRLVMSWAWDHEPDVESLLEISFDPSPQGTQVTLTHSRLPAAGSDGHEAGWNGALDKLRARAEQIAQG